MTYPSDYEQCGDCGYDHQYESQDAHLFHVGETAPKVTMLYRSTSECHLAEQHGFTQHNQYLDEDGYCLHCGGK